MLYKYACILISSSVFAIDTDDSGDDKSRKILCHWGNSMKIETLKRNILCSLIRVNCNNVMVHKYSNAGIPPKGTDTRQYDLQVDTK